MTRKIEFVYLNFPSNPTHPLDLQSTGMEHINTLESGSSNGRNDSVCAHIGVSSMAGTEGWTMDPPAAREQAVDPKIKQNKINEKEIEDKVILNSTNTIEFNAVRYKTT